MGPKKKDIKDTKDLKDGNRQIFLWASLVSLASLLSFGEGLHP